MLISPIKFFNPDLSYNSQREKLFINTQALPNNISKVFALNLKPLHKDVVSFSGRCINPLWDDFYSQIKKVFPNEKLEDIAYKLVSIDKNKLGEGKKKKVYNTTTFVDIAGLVKGASKGEGLGNKFLSHIREVNAVLHVVRVFEDGNITHIGEVDPLRDLDIILTELMLADIETINARMEKQKKAAKGAKGKAAEEEVALLEKILPELNNFKPVFSLDLTDTEKEILRPLFLLTAKSMMIGANLSENELANPEKNSNYVTLQKYANERNIELIPFSAKIEADLQDLDEEERLSYLEDLGVKESGVARLTKAGHRLLKLLTFLTSGEDETRAWTVREGAYAPEAAGVIHSDFERGFISAEVINCDKLLELGSFVKAKEAGAIRLEGKQYLMQEGDVVTFRFNV